METELAQLVEAYRASRLRRREFLARVTAVTGSYALAHHWLETSGVAATVVSPQESAAAGVDSSTEKYPSGDVQAEGYLSRPRKPGRHPGILVIHENRGLNEHIRDVARRFAAQGFAALAPDALARRGGTASMENPDKARDAIGTLTPEEVMRDLMAGFDFLTERKEVDLRRIASIGFCWGGARSFLLATANPKLRAAVVFYGTTPPAEKLAAIACPVLGIYGEKDERITGRVPETAEQMKKAGKRFEYKIYPGADHAFFNDTSPTRYHAEAAKDAWALTLKFLRAHLA